MTLGTINSSSLRVGVIWKEVVRKSILQSSTARNTISLCKIHFNKIITPTPTVPPSGTPQNIDLGALASLHGARPFPDTNEWNRIVENDDVDPNSQNYISTIGLATKVHPDFGTVWDGADD